MKSGAVALNRKGTFSLDCEICFSLQHLPRIKFKEQFVVMVLIIP